ncbi:MAG: ytxJ [Acidobacteria bacterium]|nr:ytxJ [Acidobacteriota bacterium]
MENHFKRITSKEALDELIARSNKEPVALFKHSTTCPISASAYREMEDIPGEIALIEVQRARSLSIEIGEQTGIAHESPQVIILRNGKAVWHASHWKVTAQAVEQAMSENA